MRPSHVPLRAAQPCPCGSGLANGDCHGVREVDYLAPAQRDSDRPQVSARDRPLASDPRTFSSGIATRCHACGAVLTVGLGFGDGDVVLVCECGAWNEAPRAAVSPRRDA
jgi:hypothetical protein